MGGHPYESRFGEGTVCTITLPLTIDFEASSTLNEHHAHDRATLAGMNILLAEDNDLNREIALFSLTEAGAKVTCADDGFEALGAFEQAEAGTFDLILMDIMMPNMNGYEATRAIRKLARQDAHAIPIVAMSANAFTEDKVRCREAGMDGHLTKPIDSDKLIDALAKIMAAKEGKRQRDGFLSKVGGLWYAQELSALLRRVSPCLPLTFSLDKENGPNRRSRFCDPPLC